MFPVLFALGPFTLYSFGLFALFALIVGVFVYYRNIRRDVSDIEKILDSVLYAIVGGFLAARLGFVLLHPDIFFPNPLRFFDFIHYGGFVYYGALLGGFLGLVRYSRKHKLPLRSMLDSAAVAISISHAIGLIGSFLSGSSYGSPTNLPWGVAMVGHLEKRHPVQLVEMLVELGIFLLLSTRIRKLHQSGSIAAMYVLLYAIGRIVLEFLRGDSVYWLGFKSQWVLSVIVLLVVLFYTQAFLKRGQKKASSAPKPVLIEQSYTQRGDQQSL